MGRQLIVAGLYRDLNRLKGRGRAEVQLTNWGIGSLYSSDRSIPVSGQMPWSFIRKFDVRWMVLGAHWSERSR